MTKIVKTLPITENELADFKKKKIEKWINIGCEKIEWKLKALVEFIDEQVKSQDYIYIDNKDVYYIPSIVGLFPNVNKFDTSRYGYANNILDEEIIQKSYSLKVGDFNGDLPTEIEVNKCVENKLIRSDNFIKLNCCRYYGLTYKKEKEFWSYDVCCQRKDLFGKGDGHIIWIMPIYRLNGINSKPISGVKTLLLWLENDLIPNQNWFKYKDLIKVYRLLMDCYKKYKDYLTINGKDIIFFKNKIYDDLVNGKDFDFLTHKQ